MLDAGLMGEILDSGFWILEAGGGIKGRDAGWEKILPQRRGGREMLDAGLMRANQRIQETGVRIQKTGLDKSIFDSRALFMSLFLETPILNAFYCISRWASILTSVF